MAHMIRPGSSNIDISVQHECLIAQEPLGISVMISTDGERRQRKLQPLETRHVRTCRCAYQAIQVLGIPCQAGHAVVLREGRDKWLCKHPAENNCDVLLKMGGLPPGIPPSLRNCTPFDHAAINQAVRSSTPV